MGAPDMSIKILVVEEHDLLRAKIAEILARDERISEVVQVASYANLLSAIGAARPTLILGDFVGFRKFMETSGASGAEWLPESNFLLYSDRFDQLPMENPNEYSGRRLFNLIHISSEVSNFIDGVKPDDGSKWEKGDARK